MVSLEPARRAWARLAPPTWVVFPLGLFLATRVAMMAISYSAMRMMPRLYFPRGIPEAYLQQYPALDGLCRWDCGWYERIARQGYTEVTDTAFWPLFPMMARGLHLATGIHLQLCLLIVANACAVLAFL